MSKKQLVVIGLSGKSRTGKSYMSVELLNLLGLGWRVLSFATALKQEVSELLNIPIGYCSTEVGKQKVVCVPYSIGAEEDYYKPPKTKMTVRELLQWWGTDVRRQHDSGYWTKKMANRLADLNAQGVPGVIIDDVRFVDEAELVKNSEGYLIRLRPYPEWKENPETGQHESEIALDNYEGFDFSASPSYGQLPVMAQIIYGNMKAGGRL